MNKANESARAAPGPERERFSVYEMTTETQKGETVRGAFIVLKKGRQIRFTSLERVFSGTGKTVTHYGVSKKKKLTDVCTFLNDLWEKYPDKSPEELLSLISLDELQAHFDRYAAREGLSDGTIERHIRYVTDFAAGLAERYPDVSGYSPEDLYIKEPSGGPKRGKWHGRRKRTPVFRVQTPGEASGAFRDLPVKALGLLLQLAFLYAADIAFAICLQAFSGLREGEVLSIRQSRSCFGPGIRFIRNGGTTERIFLDVRKNYRLRKDRVNTGGAIKRLREAEIFPAFIPACETAYERHLHFLSTRTFDEERAPMFINSYGRAMSYDTYLDRFDALIDEHFRPALLASADPELRAYGFLLQDHRLKPHSLRHTYSVMLVLLGCPLEQLQLYRGDVSPESSWVYLRSKADLAKKYTESQTGLAAFLADAVRFINEEGDEDHV